MIRRLPDYVAQHIGPWVAIIVLMLIAAMMGAYIVMTNTQPVNPIGDDGLIELDPPDGVLDRDRIDRFALVRRVCSIRDEQVDVIREWNEVAPNDGARVTVVWSRATFFARTGCHIVRIEQHIPESLPPGGYYYEVGLRACPAVGHCATRQLPPIPVAVRGGKRWSHMDQSEIVSPPPPRATAGGGR